MPTHCPVPPLTTKPLCAVTTSRRLSPATTPWIWQLGLLAKMQVWGGGGFGDCRRLVTTTLESPIPYTEVTVTVTALAAPLPSRHKAASRHKRRMSIVGCTPPPRVSRASSGDLSYRLAALDCPGSRLVRALCLFHLLLSELW